jgi:hypothetical protein
VAAVSRSLLWMFLAFYCVSEHQVHIYVAHFAVYLILSDEVKNNKLSTISTFYGVQRAQKILENFT